MGSGQEVGVLANKERERPSVTVDIVAVACRSGQAQVLLVKRKKPPFESCWALPGGFVEPNEPLAIAALRELREETGLEPAGLEQLQAFGDPGRDPRGWTISIAFLAILSEEEWQTWHPRAGSDADEVAWFSLLNLPPLAFDHERILAYAAQCVA